MNVLSWSEIEEKIAQYMKNDDSRTHNNLFQVFSELPDMDIFREDYKNMNKENNIKYDVYSSLELVLIHERRHSIAFLIDYYDRYNTIVWDYKNNRESFDTRLLWWIESIKWINNPFALYNKMKCIRDRIDWNLVSILWNEDKIDIERIISTYDNCVEEINNNIDIDINRINILLWKMLYITWKNKSSNIKIDYL